MNTLNMQLIINFLNDQKDFDFDPTQSFNLIFKQALKTLKIKEQRIIEISFVSPKEIQSINKEYRHKNTVTDVISFNYDETAKNDYILGEIYICLAQAKKQAEAYEHTLKREVCFLFTHGLLHLFGYNHIHELEAHEMFALQDEILANCKIERK